MDNEYMRRVLTPLRGFVPPAPKVVVRILDPITGRGPYVAGGPRNDQQEEVSADLNREHGWADPRGSFAHPGWAEDGLSQGYAAGFPTVPKARDWFSSGQLMSLEHAGYLGAFILVPGEDVEVGKSGKQVAFDRGEARALGMFPAMDITTSEGALERVRLFAQDLAERLYAQVTKLDETYERVGETLGRPPVLRD